MLPEFDPDHLPPGWHSHKPPRSPPRPGVNPTYDTLETERKRVCTLVEEATNSLGYHDLRGIGLAATLQVYRNYLLEIEKQQAALLSAS